MSHTSKKKVSAAGDTTARGNEQNTAAKCPMTQSECTLGCLDKGQKGRVANVAGPNRCRLMELGFTRGTEVEVARRAAFGGPMLVQLRSYKLSLRREEAEAIFLEPTPAKPPVSPSEKMS